MTPYDILCYTNSLQNLILYLDTRSEKEYNNEKVIDSTKELCEKQAQKDQKTTQEVRERQAQKDQTIKLELGEKQVQKDQIATQKVKQPSPERPKFNPSSNLAKHTSTVKYVTLCI